MISPTLGLDFALAGIPLFKTTATRWRDQIIFGWCSKRQKAFVLYAVEPTFRLILMSRCFTLWLLVFSCFSLAAQTPPRISPVDSNHSEIVPYLSFQDLQALYPPKRPIGDWNSPKLDQVPHKDELIARCNRDLELSIKANPDPVRLNRPLPPGKMYLISTNKDPDSRIILFVFGYESELTTDLFIVYYYDPV